MTAPDAAAGSGEEQSAPGPGRRWIRAIGGSVFGDRLGVALFLGTLCFVGLYWRAGVFITDTQTLVVTLDAVSEGRLWVDTATGSVFSAPGAVLSDGYVYGRNYGQVLLSLPLLWLLQFLDAVATLRVALVALWHLVALGFVRQVGHLVGARDRTVALGAGVVLASFLCNLALADRFVEVSTSLLALQLGAMLATALLAVLVYRLVARRYDTTRGCLAGGAAVAVLPVGFWASLPKRHVISALLLVGILFTFSLSRDSNGSVPVPVFGTVPAFRALAYVFVGLLAWIHAAEGIFALLALVAVDLPTAPSNDRRTLGVLAGAFCLSLVPVVVTNVLVSGDPSVPPRMLTPADSHSVSGASSDIARRFTGGGSSDIPVIGRGLRILFVVTEQVVEGAVATAQPDRFVRTWVRSGGTEFLGGGRPEFAGSNLAVVESVPLLGGFAAVITAGIAARSSLRSALARIEPTDALAVALTVAFVLLYAKRLPVHVQITVRYLLPTYPLMLYLLVRLTPVRTLLVDRRGTVCWTYAAGVLLGSQLLLALVVGGGLTVADASQVHAVLGLGTAGFLALSLVATHLDERSAPLAAIALGLAAAAGTAFVLLTGVAYFSFVGEHVLPVVEVISRIVGRI